jgi:ribosomal subunit interface protein
MRIDVRGHRVELQPALGSYAERRFLTALQRFKERVPSVTVRLIDDNGPKHGVDKRCQVSVLVLRAKPVLVEETDADPYRAIDFAADRAARAVTRAIGRRRAPRTLAAEQRAAERTGVTPHLVPAR